MNPSVAPTTTETKMTTNTMGIIVVVSSDTDTDQENVHHHHKQQLKLQQQGHRCFGGCCDTRRAVICVNVISCVLLIIGFLSLVGTQRTVLRNIANNTTMYNDDEVEQKTEEWAVGISVPFVASITGLRLACSVCGIIGAIHYNWFGVGISTVMYFFELCTSFHMSSMPIGLTCIFMNAVFLYPHLIFLHENRKGIMTKENNHHNEKKSSFCCFQRKE